MGAYILSLMVTLDQECAIQKLFTKKKWQFIRIDQTTSDGSSNISGTFTLVGKNGKKDNVAGGVKSKKKSARQLNVTSIVEGCNVNNENEHEISGDIDTASEQEFQALGITVKEEVLSDNDEENFVDNDSDYDADGIGETSGMTQVKRATKRRDDSETCEMDEEEPSVKLETGEISPEDDANILAMLEEMPDVKHISELLTSECPDSDPSSMAIPDIETDANGYITSLSVYFCKWCNYTFPELEYFKGHKRKGRCFFVCQFCKEKFTFRNFSRYQDHLREHREKASDEDVIRYSCPVCKKGFSSVYKMMKHLDNVHVYARAFYVCSRCGVKCKSRIGLKAHKKTHELICSHCGKVYSAVSTLNAHIIRVHSGMKFICNFPNCEYVGNTEQALNFHRNTHSGLKPYKCKHCGKPYQRKDTLSRHQLLCKTGATCDKCGTKFGSKNCLKDHIRAVHSEERFVCMCGSIFKYRASLSRHQKKAGHSVAKDVEYSNELEVADMIAF